MKKRVRFGVKIPIFPNVGIVAFDASEADAEKYQEYFTGIILLLRMRNQDRIADRLFFEIAR